MKRLIFALLFLAGCAAFAGPFTKEFSCPVECPNKVCCSYGWECAKTTNPAQPCRYKGSEP